MIHCIYHHYWPHINNTGWPHHGYHGHLCKSARLNPKHEFINYFEKTLIINGITSLWLQHFIHKDKAFLYTHAVMQIGTVTKYSPTFGDNRLGSLFYLVSIKDGRKAMIIKLHTHIHCRISYREIEGILHC